MTASWKRRTVDAMCATCHQSFQAPAYKIKQGKGRTCSAKCANALRVKSRWKRQASTEHKRLDSLSRFKEAMREATGRTCQKCGKTEAENGRRLDVHRITPDEQGGTYTPENVEVLCQTCHVNRERWEAA